MPAPTIHLHDVVFRHSDSFIRLPARPQGVHRILVCDSSERCYVLLHFATKRAVIKSFRKER